MQTCEAVILTTALLSKLALIKQSLLDATSMIATLEARASEEPTSASAPLLGLLCRVWTYSELWQKTATSTEHDCRRLTCERETSRIQTSTRQACLKPILSGRICSSARWPIQILTLRIWQICAVASSLWTQVPMQTIITRRQTISLVQEMVLRPLISIRQYRSMETPWSIRINQINSLQMVWSV